MKEEENDGTGNLKGSLSPLSILISDDVRSFIIPIH